MLKTHRVLERALLWSVSVLLASGPTCFATQLFWTDYGTDRIERVNSSGGDRVPLVTTGNSDLGAIALDPTAGKMYWTDWGSNKIRRANLDGTSVEDIIGSGLVDPTGIALDLPSGKMYWADAGLGKILRANLNGTSIETVLTDTVYPPFRIALDTAAGEMYWTTIDPGSGFFPGKLAKAKLDGSSVVDIVPAQYGLHDVALDPLNSQLYWTSTFDDKIIRANLDGSDATPVVTGVKNANAIALDPASNKLYYSDLFTDTIHRAALDGTNDVVIVSTGLVATNGLALLVPEPEGIALAATALAAFVLCLRLHRIDPNTRRKFIDVESAQ